MTVVDTSAIAAILLAEPDAADFSIALQDIDPLFMSAASLLEIGTVLLHKKGVDMVSELFRLLDVAQIKIVPVSERHAREGIEAYRRFGKGSGHPARLNFGDCFSYSLAKALDVPLLFKGDDFAKTDIRSAP